MRTFSVKHGEGTREGTRQLGARVRRWSWGIWAVMLGCGLGGYSGRVWGQAGEDGKLGTTELARKYRPSVFVVSQRVRGGEGASRIGTGFAMGRPGLVATSLHVIGEGRGFFLQSLDGVRHEPLEVYAWDRKLDLAIVRIGWTNAPVLGLAGASNAAPGMEVVTIGNPLGLEHSVVAGVVAGRRVIEGVNLLQLGMPIEPGNSGGAVLDREGRVHGVVCLKSAYQRSVGFATPVEHLRALMENPNPVPMARWQQMTGVDTNVWESLFGAVWQERGDRIRVDGVGDGFGGRALLVAKGERVKRPYELTVEVRLDDESGAAGLIFGSDGGDRHYGFYPTGGQLRLTRFDGPDVFDWAILGTAPSAHYRRGEWNELRVRVEEGRMECRVNGQVIFESRDRGLGDGRVGLAKFRDTSAMFRGFWVKSGGEQPAGGGLSTNQVLAILGSGVSALPEETLLKSVATNRAMASAARSLLGARARALEQEAVKVREAAEKLHRQSVRMELAGELGRPEGEIDLMRAALLVAQHDQPELRVEPYLKRVESMAMEARGRLREGMSERERLEALVGYLFRENGFHGSRIDYYERANSYMNSVLEDREGLPITLSVLFLEMAKRMGLERVVGVPVPGHFMVKHLGEGPGGMGQLVDVFHGGKYVTHSDADEVAGGAEGVPVRTEFLAPAKKREIIVRMVNNLLRVAQQEERTSDVLGYQDLLVEVAEDDRAAGMQRLERARTLLRAGRWAEAKEDFRWVLERRPEAMDLRGVEEALRRLEGR